MIPELTAGAVKQLLGYMLASDARKATKYISPTFRVTLTRAFRRDRRNTRETLLLTYGAPNYEDRVFIKAAQRAGEPFPVRRVRLKHFPPKKLQRRRS